MKTARMRNIIVGTAGHIDHGKTALVKSLTGTDADRLAEEKRRGITIDLGFAHLQLTKDIRLGFIDVPGHERFVRNMLAGAAGIKCGICYDGQLFPEIPTEAQDIKVDFILTPSKLVKRKS